MNQNVPTDMSGFAGYLLYRLGLDTARTLEETLAPTGLRPREVRVLGLLSGEPQAQNELCRITGLDRTTMVAVVDRLEKLGLAARHRDPADRRRQAVTRTEEGVEAFDEAAGLLLVAEDAYLDPLDVAQREQLRDLLRTLYDSRRIDC
ncbi:MULTISPECIES: MarR family winged helix-turn-helix transcriptional regulator [unclassified Nocardiopsis]|uniref:MarR family winged helix-turn-helix transcriptional regulator n=1 Tax=Nocardiopsis TaxID=2013 RepID=UPI00387B40F6